MMRWTILAVILSLAPANGRAEGLPPSDATFQAIERADAALFAASYRCDIATFASLVDEDFEFYHDRTGLTPGKQALVQSTRDNLCHKVRRTLVRPSLQVFPIATYGAVETGDHRFCNVAETPVCKEDAEGSGRFVMLWRKRPDGYKLARVISYDHVDR